MLVKPLSYNSTITRLGKMFAPGSGIRLPLYRTLMSQGTSFPFLARSSEPLRLDEVSGFIRTAIPSCIINCLFQTCTWSYRYATHDGAAQLSKHLFIKVYWIALLSPLTRSSFNPFILQSSSGYCRMDMLYF